MKDTENYAWTMIITAVVLAVIVLVVPSNAMQASYTENQCELIAKDYQREFGGSMVFIQPLTADGAYDLGEFNGHWVNKAYNSKLGVYYIDYETKTYMYSLNGVRAWYEQWTGKKAEVFDLDFQHPPFPLIYHY